MGLMQQFKREIRSVNGKILAFDLRNGMGATLGGLFEKIARGKVHDAEIREIYGTEDAAEPAKARIQAGPQMMPSQKAGKFTALVSMHGVALYDLEYQPYCFSTSLLATILDQLGNDPMIDTIVLDINTPGGHVTGTQEAADAVWAARKKKTVIGIVNPLCASAGYWIGSQCTKLIGVPSADIGSIGVFMTHYDCSAMLADSGIKPTFIYAGEHKVEGNSMEPLSADALAWFQSEVNDTYQQFLAAVARGRGITADKVEEKFGKGRCYGAPMAKRVGMIDEIATIKQAFKGVGLTVEMPMDTGGRRRGEAEDPAQAQAEAFPLTANELGEATDLSALDAELGQITAKPLTDESAAEIAADGIAAAGTESVGARTGGWMSTEGCEHITFIQEQKKPGVRTTYARDPWPAKSAMDPVIFNGALSNGCVTQFGNLVTIAVANGAAVYEKVGETEAGVWICELKANSSFEPIPPQEPVALPPGAGMANLRNAGAALEAEAAAEANRKAAAAARRRLALLSA